MFAKTEGGIKRAEQITKEKLKELGLEISQDQLWKIWSSNFGSSTFTTACWMIRSSILGMPNGRFFPFFFGMYTLRTGDGLYLSTYPLPFTG
ncbi:hypothetical protein J2S08_004318 [Bacillus chungangensis]|uniref:Uncharacterized protein n=1 Tax=Bacillus chungangensis TaxID=587633 RepID=A0ABT9WZ65_9BACI|nr:hypothetical protein [Bacillus chungangensis]